MAQRKYPIITVSFVNPDEIKLREKILKLAKKNKRSASKEVICILESKDLS